METNDVKVVINSVEAVERLIGGDSSVEIELRNKIVQEFSKKFLVSVADKIVNMDVQAMQKSIADTTYKRLWKEYSDPVWHNKIQVPKDIMDDLKKQLDTQLKETADTFLKSITYDARKELQDAVKVCTDLAKADIVAFFKSYTTKENLTATIKNMVKEVITEMVMR